MTASPTLQLGDIFRADFRTSAEADDLNGRLQKAFGLDYRYQPARLAIALSLSDPTAPEAAPDLLGKPIRGETLFGQDELDTAFWVALIVEHAALASTTRRAVQELVGAHWRRGLGHLEALQGTDSGPGGSPLGDLPAKLGAHGMMATG